MPGPGVEGARSRRSVSARENEDRKSVAEKSEAQERAFFTQPEVQTQTKSIAKSIAEAGETNIFQDFFGITKTGKVDLTGDIGADFSLNVSPLSIAASMLGGIPGAIAGQIAKTAGIEDPLGFKIGLDAGDTSVAGITERADFSGILKEDDTQTKRAEQAAIKKEVEAQKEPEDALEAAVNDILQQRAFTAFAMPEFRLLSNFFGKDNPVLDEVGEG